MFTVIYDDIQKLSSGIWALSHSTFGCTHNLTFTLDEEDIQYLYNKYKDRAQEEATQEEQERQQRKQEEIEKLEQQLKKLKDESGN